jgi:DNA-binding response OmpR family regulator
VTRIFPAKAHYRKGMFLGVPTVGVRNFMVLLDLHRIRCHYSRNFGAFRCGRLALFAPTSSRWQTSRREVRAMKNPALAPPVIHFGVCEFNSQTGDLRRHGLKVKLQPQALKILSLLLERPGEIRTREELQ